ncbi:MAG TPA: M20/M25/M40 family metallo-hydrolase [Pyrinomonadaceae bacterium]|jgi:Zn-dependent M28 family amino/carboxypeptidase
MKRFLSILFLTLALSPLAAQTAAIAPKSKTLDAARLLRDLETLSADDMEGRGIGTKGGEKAREYIVRRFNESGIKPFQNNLVQPFEFTTRDGAKVRGANVVGFIEGAKYKDKYIVVSAHYDHEGIVKGEIYNGADDNASGTAALFALAEYFKKNRPAHTIVFAAFDGEESGLRGARAFVAAPPVAKEKIALNVNLDMVSRSAKRELYAVGTYHYPQLKPALERAAKISKIKLLLGHDRPEQERDDWTTQSDHGAFHAQKIPFVYFGVEDHADYHKPTDDFANITQEFYVRAVETILDAVKGLDKDLESRR